MHHLLLSHAGLRTPPLLSIVDKCCETASGMKLWPSEWLQHAAVPAIVSPIVAWAMLTRYRWGPPLNAMLAYQVTA